MKLLNKYTEVYLVIKRIMSYISNSPRSKLQASWKVSDNSRISSKEKNMKQGSFQLPERFMPSKKITSPSSILNCSKDSIKLYKRDQGNNQSFHSPQKDKNNHVVSASTIHLKQSIQIQDSPMKMTLQPTRSLPGLDISAFKKLESQLMMSNDQNKTILHQLKLDFLNFKRQVLNELQCQKDMMFQISREVFKKLDQVQRVCSQTVRYSHQSRSAIVTNVAKIQDEVVTSLNKLSSFQAIIQGSQKQILPIVKLEVADENKWNAEEIVQTVQCQVSQPVLVAVQTEQKQKQKVSTPIKQANNQINEVVESKIRLNVVQSSPKNMNSKQKCNHIVQTIEMLSEINASPVHDKARSIDKLAIDQYKQKLISVSKSNEILIPDRNKPKPTLNEEQAKTKSNFKLDKFYNAIQKLKQQVNQIRHISDNQTRKTRVLKIYQ